MSESTINDAVMLANARCGRKVAFDGPSILGGARHVWYPSEKRPGSHEYARHLAWWRRDPHVSRAKAAFHGSVTTWHRKRWNTPQSSQSGFLSNIKVKAMAFGRNLNAHAVHCA
jgi:hypothetical protein